MKKKKETFFFSLHFLLEARVKATSTFDILITISISEENVKTELEL